MGNEGICCLLVFNFRTELKMAMVLHHIGSRARAFRTRADASLAEWCEDASVGRVRACVCACVCKCVVSRQTPASGAHARAWHDPGGFKLSGNPSVLL